MQPDTPAKPELAVLLAAFLGLVAATSSLEGIWYLEVAAALYQKHIGLLMNAQFDVAVAVLFYLLYSLGALVFALQPALACGSWAYAVRAGALYGFFCFCAHNLTDLADMKGYSSVIVMVDIAWGTCMSAVACALAYRLARSVRRRPPPILPAMRQA